MIVCILVFRVDSLTYTIAKALSHGGCNVFIKSISQEHVCEIDTRLMTMLVSTPGVIAASASTAEIPQEVDLLIIQGHPKLLEYRPMLDELARRSKNLTVISTGDRKCSFRQALARQWHEILWYGRWLRIVKQVTYKDGYYASDLFGLFLPRYVVGFDAHSKFLGDKKVFKIIHTFDWELEEQRPILVNFLGSVDPDRRKRILDNIRGYFVQPNGKEVEIEHEKKMFWHEFSDAQPAALDVTEYLGVLTRSGFTLCPPGYSLVTHRPIEALLRGSIPVLNASELDLYDIGFIDGVNCIAVPPGQWAAAMERILSTTVESVIEMRKNIYAMLEDQIDYDALSRHIRTRLGVEDAKDI